MSCKIEKHILVTEDTFAVDVIAAKTELSKQRIKLAMKNGAVWLEHGTQKIQRLRRAKRLVKKNDVLHLYYNEALLSEKALPCELIADEGAYSIWYKPTGVLSQGSKWGDHCTINRYAEENLTPQRAAFIIHRLDRAARGLMLLAHKKQTASALAALFEQRTIDKTYQAVVHGCFPSTTQTITTPINEKSATSHVKLIRYQIKKDRSLIEINIESGRKHQIRRHLQSLGFPIIGDRLYGNELAHSEDLQLSSYSLSFTCPITQQHKYYELPKEKQLQL